jgi:hypothetical protein
MADETLTGAATEVTVTPKDTEDTKKKIIKYVLIVLVVVGAIFLIKKYVLKK